METKRTYLLEMADPSEISAKLTDQAGFDVRRVEVACPELNWFFHEAVGAEFRWTGRDDWSAARWAQYVDRPEFETWIGYVSGTPAGYYELEKQKDGSVRIVCFGLLGKFLARGLGGPFLTTAIQRCWEIGASRVWLTTCTHDHPHALNNYLARGFKLVDERSGPANPLRRTTLFSPRRETEW